MIIRELTTVWSFLDTSVLKKKNKEDRVGHILPQSLIDKNPLHVYCPSDSSSWYKWCKEEAENAIFRHNPSLSDKVIHVIKSIYEDLS